MNRLSFRLRHILCTVMAVLSSVAGAAEPASLEGVWRRKRPAVRFYFSRTEGDGLAVECGYKGQIQLVGRWEGRFDGTYFHGKWADHSGEQQGDVRVELVREDLALVHWWYGPLRQENFDGVYYIYKLSDTPGAFLELAEEAHRWRWQLIARRCEEAARENLSQKEWLERSRQIRTEIEQAQRWDHAWWLPERMRDVLLAEGTFWQLEQFFSDRRGPLSIPGAPLSSVTDGLSNTAVMSEALLSPADPHHFHRADAWYAGLNPQGDPPPTNEEVVSLCRAAGVNPLPAYRYVGHDWPVSGLGHAGYNHVVAPNANATNCRLGSPSLTAGVDHYWPVGLLKASSHHPGGVNLLLLDGSARFASDNIDLQVWQAISTRAGGESQTHF